MTKGKHIRTQEIKEKYRLSHIGKHHSEETKNKIRLQRINKTYEDMVGIQRAIKWKTGIKRKLNIQWNNPINKIKASQRIINTLISGKMKKISKAELILKQYLRDNNVKFIHQYPFKLGIADFYLPDKNLIIECYGGYWHSLLSYIEIRKKKNQWLDDNGYKVLIYCSEDIVDNQKSLNKFIDINLMKGGIKI